MFSHCPRGVTKQFLCVVQVFGVGGSLGAQVAELKADACFLPCAVEAAAQFADAQWLAFVVLDEGQAGSGDADGSGRDLRRFSVCR